MILLSRSGLWEMIVLFFLPLCLFKKLRPYVFPALVNCAISALMLRNGIAQLVGRVRPSNFPFAHPLDPIYGAPSWPSGHSTAVFSVAFMLLLLLKGTKHAWVAWCVFVWACFVGFSRVYIGVHFPTDVLAGAALGLATAAAIWLFMERKGWLPKATE
jgi:undecaprenyl-diphosphatase